MHALGETPLDVCLAWVMSGPRLRGLQETDFTKLRSAMTPHAHSTSRNYLVANICPVKLGCFDFGGLSTSRSMRMLSLSMKACTA